MCSILYDSVAFYTNIKIFFQCVSVELVEEIFMWPLLNAYKSAVLVHSLLYATQQCHFKKLMISGSQSQTEAVLIITKNSVSFLREYFVF